MARMFKTHEIVNYEDPSTGIKVPVKVIWCVPDDPTEPLYYIRDIEKFTYTHAFERFLSKRE